MLAHSTALSWFQRSSLNHNSFHKRRQGMAFHTVDDRTRAQLGRWGCQWNYSESITSRLQMLAHGTALSKFESQQLSQTEGPFGRDWHSTQSMTGLEHSQVGGGTTLLTTTRGFPPPPAPVLVPPPAPEAGMHYEFSSTGISTSDESIWWTGQNQSMHCNDYERTAFHHFWSRLLSP